ncbi:MAG TPA: prephenate dehydrogenase/arogenate dehydrogenase family protein [Bryobacteraceae bacterium]|jgi:prephenate dehydrogenase|nr:prephenate dehydrogenase/arogenate dehydrogenase family protein [Bryobacteraceae bacterium]
MRTVAIIGTGLIGSSFGLALRAAGFGGTIVGVSSERAIADALACRAIDGSAPLAEAVAEADLVFLSQTIGRILDTIRHLDPLLKPGALVTDAGSTKCEIVDTARQAIRRAQFLGGHPMAGKETRGAAAADAGLFRGRTWVLTPDEPAEMETAAAREFRGWLRRIGARITVLDADEHDRVVARTSHLPQLASTALAALLEGTPHTAVSGSGLLDMTRLALSSYDLWRDILATNSGHIDGALSAYIQELEHIRENLRTRQLQEEFGRGARMSARLREEK